MHFIWQYIKYQVTRFDKFLIVNLGSNKLFIKFDIEFTVKIKNVNIHSIKQLH